MKKKNIVSKLYLKFTDKPAYKQYKWDLVNYKQHDLENFLIGNQRLNSVPKIMAVAKAKGQLNFTHGGNAGDIIYALPTLKKIQELTGVPINLYLRLGKPMALRLYNAHPLGNVMLNQKMADLLFPLLRAQSYISKCEVYTNEVIDIDLDNFRAGLIPQDKGNIAHWCGYITGVSPDLYTNWLTVKPDTTYAESIVIARSGRYQNRSIDYAFLNKYSNLQFIGIESEYLEMKKMVPGLLWLQVADFLQLAQIVAGAKLFMGNQSFPFSIAEGLKATRILEVSFEVINVIPEGPGGHDFFFQEHLEWLVEHLAK
jgi:hypothetical protein